VRYTQSAKIIEVIAVPTVENIADLMTKVLDRKTFERFVRNVMNVITPVPVLSFMSMMVQRDRSAGRSRAGGALYVGSNPAREYGYKPSNSALVTNGSYARVAPVPCACPLGCLTEVDPHVQVYCDSCLGHAVDGTVPCECDKCGECSCCCSCCNCDPSELCDSCLVFPWGDRVARDIVEDEWDDNASFATLADPFEDELEADLIIGDDDDSVSTYELCEMCELDEVMDDSVDVVAVLDDSEAVPAQHPMGECPGEPTMERADGALMQFRVVPTGRKCSCTTRGGCRRMLVDTDDDLCWVCVMDHPDGACQCTMPTCDCCEPNLPGRYVYGRGDDETCRGNETGVLYFYP